MGVLVGVSKMSYLTQPLTQMFPVFHSVLGHWYPMILDSSPMGCFFSYKKCPILFSLLPTGEIILSGGKDGLVAVSNPHTGITLRVLADHKGSPITVLQCTRKQVRPHPCPSAGQEQVPRVSPHSCGKQQQRSQVGPSSSFTFPLCVPIPSNIFSSVFLGIYSVE